MKYTKEELTKRRRADDDTEIHASNVYMDDWLRILQAKASRRTNGKTQVYRNPRDPHVRTRAVHTNEVTSNAVLIADALGLDINLVMAIAAGHDIGHVPFGHLGEEVLQKISNKAFHHAKFGVVVAQHIERKGRGLNSCKATYLGMEYHSKAKHSISLRNDLPQECIIVMLADEIAYIFSDFNDASKRYKNHIEGKPFPKELDVLGMDQRERVHNVVHALINESKKKGYVSFSEGEIFKIFKTLRQWMDVNIYRKVDRKLQVDAMYAVYEYISKANFLKAYDSILLLALMTDKEVLWLASQLMSSNEVNESDLRYFCFMEDLPYLKDREIDIVDPDLDW